MEVQEVTMEVQEESLKYLVDGPNPTTQLTVFNSYSELMLLNPSIFFFI